jgi:serine/threonine protein kinase
LPCTIALLSDYQHSQLNQRHRPTCRLQPANILMSLQGEAKIADFGISAFVANTVANVRGPVSLRLALLVA